MSFHKSELADMLRKKYGQVSAVCCRLPTLGVPTRYLLAARIAAERSCSTLIHGSRDCWESSGVDDGGARVDLSFEAAASFVD
jgi:hypothetical protein